MTKRIVQYTEEEVAALRTRARSEGRSMQSVVVEEVGRRAMGERVRLYEEAAAHVLEVSAELNRRLA
jgi:hypothetical protein